MLCSEHFIHCTSLMCLNHFRICFTWIKKRLYSIFINSKHLFPHYNQNKKGVTEGKPRFASWCPMHNDIRTEKNIPKKKRSKYLQYIATMDSA